MRFAVASGAALANRGVNAHKTLSNGIPRRISGQRVAQSHRFLLDQPDITAWPAATRKCDVVIVGGGPSGLAALWKLVRAGKDVVLLEAERVVGGTCRFGEGSLMKAPLGSVYFYRNGGEVKDLFDDVGFRPELTGEDAQLFDGAAIVDDFWSARGISSLPIPERDKDAFRKFRDILLAMKPIPSYPLRDASVGLVREYDGMSGADFVRRFGSDVLMNRLNLFSRSVLGAPLDVVNAYAFINFYAGEFGAEFATPCFGAKGGMATLTEAIRERAGRDHIIMNSLAVAVEENTERKVGVKFVDGAGTKVTIDAAAAIVAVEKKIAKRIVRGLPSARVEAMSSVRYAPYITCLLSTTAPLYPAGIFDCWIDDSKGRLTDILDTSIAGSSSPLPHHTYLAFSPRPESERASLTDNRVLETRVDDILTAVGEHFPGSREIVREAELFVWGHSMVIPHVGSHTLLAPLLAQPHGRIHFASADNDIAPGLENALEQGLHAAASVMTVLRK